MCESSTNDLQSSKGNVDDRQSDLWRETTDINAYIAENQTCKMARKKRGGKLSTAKKYRRTKEYSTEEQVVQSPADESEESCSSGTPKSCNTPVEVDKQSSNTTLVQHKKFGKFRCLLIDEANKSEISSSESELQVDPPEMEVKNSDLVDQNQQFITDLKCMDINETDTLQDMPVSAEEVVQDEIVLDSVESVCELQILDDGSQEQNEQVYNEINTEVDVEKDKDKDKDGNGDNDGDADADPDPDVDADPDGDADADGDADIDLDENRITLDAASDDSKANPVVRRSSRIRSITVLKQRNKGHGLVKTKLQKLRNDIDMIIENGNVGSTSTDRVPSADSPSSFVPPTFIPDCEVKPVKVKSRWRRSSELEMGSTSPIFTPSQASPLASVDAMATDVVSNEVSPVHDEELETRMSQFQMLTENQYLTDRVCCKEAKKMVCDCFLTKEEIERGELACGQDCLNRLLMIECGSGCAIGDRCTNKRFQNLQYAPCEVFRTIKKGYGIRATAEIPFGEFILEYVGEVVDRMEFEKRAKEYSKDNNEHYYFMALRNDAVIDATQKGNISRFINHSCDPNAETQKWTVNGELRIGFFSTRTIIPGEEITFDYHFQRYGKEAQKCYCEASTCRGWIGEEPDDEEFDEDESEREEEIEDEEDKEEDVPENQIKTVKRTPKVPRRRKPAKPPRTDLFEDSDLDEVIGTLSRTGVKNQLHTLKLSQMMVRAKDVGPRIKLLQLLREGDLPCRRLFLDYHGLRLIHGWMCDAQCMSETENSNNMYRREILLTLASLPIPNKTMLIDSKVLETVEVWSTGATIVETSPVDSESNSPQINSVVAAVTPVVSKECEQVEIMGADTTKDELKVDDIEIKEESTQHTTIQLDIVKEEVEEKSDKDDEKLIVDLTAKLLSDWSVLKEIFRIPKKERIEQMKEHEREADRDYEGDGKMEHDITGKRYSWKSERSRTSDKERRKNKEVSEHERVVTKKGVRLEERNIVPLRKLSKHERRQLFALQVAQADEGRRRKAEEELWRQHEQRCIALGVDPRVTGFETAANYCYWNQNNAQWQTYDTNGTQQTPTTTVTPSTTTESTTSPTETTTTTTTAPVSTTCTQDTPKDDWSLYYPEDTVFPEPVKLPPKWKMCRDDYGRPYYYHIKIRVSQWSPPELPNEETPTDIMDETSSSSESSSVSPDTSTDSDEDIELGDTRLMLDIRNKLQNSDKENSTHDESISNLVTISDSKTESPKPDTPDEPQKSNDIVQKRKRDGLVQEIIISPRREEDKLAHKAELKKYRETKEKLRKQKQILFEQSKKKLKSKNGKTNSSKSSKKHRSSKSLKHKIRSGNNSEQAKKLKEQFRSSMAGIMVQYLNAYRKPDCKTGRITNTDDFKHLARKLTHFVMVKELKHCQSIEELVCNDSVKSKAKDFVKKYMSKFGEVYVRPKDDLD